MGKMFGTVCEYCYIKSLKFVSNCNEESGYSHAVVIEFELQDINKKRMQNALASRDDVVVKTTEKYLTIKESLDLYSKPSVRKKILNKIKELKKEYADYDYEV